MLAFDVFTGILFSIFGGIKGHSCKLLIDVDPLLLDIIINADVILAKTILFEISLVDKNGFEIVVVNTFCVGTG
jgi:hypothetical protein